jgi:hypothetical protein
MWLSSGGQYTACFVSWGQASQSGYQFVTKNSFPQLTDQPAAWKSVINEKIIVKSASLRFPYLKPE